MDKPNLFISYSWLNTDIADEIDNKFQSIGIKFMRDVRDISDFHSLSDFMKKVRENDYVIMIISDAYLKSKNCMYEVLEFMKEPNYKTRILPIIVKDAIGIFSDKGKLSYIEYWQKEFVSLQNKISQLDLMNVTKLIEQLKFIEKICREIEEFLFILSDKKLKTLEELKELHYKPIFDFIGYDGDLTVSDFANILFIKDIEEQNVELEKYRAKYGETTHLCFFKGYYANKNKNYKLAKYFYEKSLEADPNNAQSHNNLAILLNLHYSDYIGSRMHYEKSLETNSNLAFTHNNFASLLMTDYYKDYEGAREHYEKALDINPDYANAHCGLARLLMTSYYKDYYGARKHFEIALDINNQYVNAHRWLARLLMMEQIKDYNEARKHLEKSLEIDPNNANVHNDFAGLLLEHYNNYEDARNHLEKALNIDPQNIEAHFNFAILLGTMHYKDYEGAKKHYEKALDINPQYAIAHNNLACLLSDHFMDYESSRKNYYKALEIDPNFAEAHYNLALLLLSHFKDYKGGRNNLEKAIEIDSNYGAAHFQLAHLLATPHFNEYDSAIKHYEIAARINPQLSPIPVNLGIEKIEKLSEDLIGIKFRFQ
jgi:tetratricopeptide (TPR) repeat protein